MRYNLRGFELLKKFYLYFNSFYSFSTEHSGSKSPKTDTCNSSFNCSKKTSQEAMEEEFWQKLFSKCTFIIASGTCNKSLRMKSRLCEKLKFEFPLLFSTQIWLLVFCSCRYKVTLWSALYFSEPTTCYSFSFLVI